MSAIELKVFITDRKDVKVRLCQDNLRLYILTQKKNYESHTTQCTHLPLHCVGSCNSCTVRDYIGSRLLVCIEIKQKYVSA